MNTREAITNPLSTSRAEVPLARPARRGKFLFRGEDKLYVRGVTYGTFRPAAWGGEFPHPDRVHADFALMAANGVNAVRTYTPPPVWMLDLAARHGLGVMAGLAAERSAAFLDYRKCVASIDRSMRHEIAQMAGHPALLCYAIGNEIPASVVRWHGRRRVERFLERLYRTVKEEDPEGLVTYVNYPSTEYLDLPFLDLLAFNVYLESEERYEAYVARLHNVAGDRPLVMAEIGLDSLRHGEEEQARFLDREVRATFTQGCAGVFVYAWTDEWFRGGAEVTDWEFGLTRRDRAAKPALAAVKRAFADVPFGKEIEWPSVSVVLCSYNGARTIRETCEGLRRLEYPCYDVVVVDDGSTDDTAAIAASYGFRLIQTPNRGLSAARNIGLKAATGSIVAYIDDDARPDPHWLHYLVSTLLRQDGGEHAGVGGPNLPPPGDGLVADCVAHSPGGPSHVLLSDRVAEHIPGCNMAFHRSRLRAIGGFDTQFRAAGDDVDVCWRLQQRGWTLGFSPAAVVWHHRRNTVRGYLRQQLGYGRAEAMLERKWPDKYSPGHPTWAGRLYDGSSLFTHSQRGRVYHGVWGLAPYQRLYQETPRLLAWLPFMPEWYVVLSVLVLLSGLSAVWEPLRINLSLLCVALAAPVAQAARCVARSSTPAPGLSRWQRLERSVLTTFLHLVQPPARLWGRLRQGLALRRGGSAGGTVAPRSWVADIWSPRCDSPESRLLSLETRLRQGGHVPERGSDFDCWDLQVRPGMSGSARLSLAVEFHGDGRQLLRVRCWPRVSIQSLVLIGLFSALTLGAGFEARWLAASVLGMVTLLLALRAIRECGGSTAAFLAAVRGLQEECEGKTDAAR